MILRFNRDNYAKNLPDVYRKNAGSNNDKILRIEKEEADRLREAVHSIYESLDLDTATGKTLDLYGEMVGQERGKASDAQYRVLIKGRIIRNFANGDYNSVVNALATTFGCSPTEISLTELDEPCKVQIGEIPFSLLNRVSIDINTAIKIIKGLMPVGVWLDSGTFTGTFEFSGGTELVYDESKGFADIDQTIGGTLGLVFNGDTPELPI